MARTAGLFEQTRYIPENLPHSCFLTSLTLLPQLSKKVKLLMLEKRKKGMSYLGGRNQAMLFNIGYARNENLCISIPAVILEYNISENY